MQCDGSKYCGIGQQQQPQATNRWLAEASTSNISGLEEFPHAKVPAQFFQPVGGRRMRETMGPQHERLFKFLTLFASLSCLAGGGYAHVILEYPKARTENDYLFTFDDGVCVNGGCNNFCGDPYRKEQNPLTVLQVGVPITLRWKTNVAHEPFLYRFSLNPNPGDGNFDSPQNILLVASNNDAADPSNLGLTGTFSASVVISPELLDSCAQDKDPCVLQLYDMYYFVSCANVHLSSVPVETGTSISTSAPVSVSVPAPSSAPLSPHTDGRIQGETITVIAASFVDYRVTVGASQPQLDPVLHLSRCRPYTFIINSPGHPFVFKTQPSSGLENLLELGAPANGYFEVVGDFPSHTNKGVENGVFTLTVGKDAPGGDVFYQCTLHNEMVSRIIIGESRDECESRPPDTDPASRVNSISFLALVGVFMGLFIAGS